jgi:hypothetical protein
MKIQDVEPASTAGDVMINFLESEFLSDAAKKHFANFDYESPEFQTWYQPLMYGDTQPRNSFEVELVLARRLYLAKFWTRPPTTVQS